MFQSARRGVAGELQPPVRGVIREQATPGGRSEAGRYASGDSGGPRPIKEYAKNIQEYAENTQVRELTRRNSRIRRSAAAMLRA